MSIHSTTSIPPPLQLLSENSSTAAHLDEVLKFINLNPPLKLDLGVKIRFGIITALMLLIILLYLIRMVQAFLDRDYRVIERNRNGYLNPNIEVLLPIFAILNSTMVMCSIISMQHDDGRYLSRVTLTTQMFSYVFLFFCAVTRVWKTLSIIPTVPVQVTPSRRSLLTSGLPPSLFNFLVVLAYISVPAVTLPLGLKIANRIAKLGKETFELIPVTKVIVAKYQNSLAGDAIATTLMEEIIIILHSNQNLLKQLDFWWRLICVIYMVFCLSLFIAFNYASTRLYSTLTVQIQILSQARRRFARMASVGMRSFEDETPSATIQSVQLHTKCHQLTKPLKKLRESIWAESQDQTEMLEFWSSFDSCTENAELARKFQMSIRYRTVVCWQWLFSSLIFLAFLILMFCSILNVFGMHGVSLVRIILIVHEWAGWAWALPGIALAFLTCCVALMPHSNPRTNALARNMIHNQSPGEHRFQADLSRSSIEIDAVKLRSYTTFLPETPPPSSKATVTNDCRYLGRKMWRKFQTSEPPNSPESQRTRKFSCFSVADDEKAEEHKSQPETGLHVHEESSRPPHCIYIPKVEFALPTSQITSDVNIIKSLHRDT